MKDVMNNQNEGHSKKPAMEYPNTSKKNQNPLIRWDIIMTIIGLIMIIYSLYRIPGAGQIVNNEWVPSKLLSFFKGMIVFGLVFFVFGFFKWITFSWNKQSN
jgi:hypothetical protein